MQNDQAPEPVDISAISVVDQSLLSLLDSNGQQLTMTGVSLGFSAGTMSDS